MGDLVRNVIASLSKIGLVPHLNGEGWVGTFTGALSSDESGRIEIDLALDGQNTKNKLLLNIYKMPSGNYELNSYIT